MEIDDNDLGHLSYGLELDDIDDDLPHSTIVRDDHDLLSESDRMYEDSLASLTLADKPVRKLFRKTKKSPGSRSRGDKLGGNEGKRLEKTWREPQSAQKSERNPANQPRLTLLHGQSFLLVPLASHK